mmetsp:Transcript_48985/g.59087  ORF Transcript_48985/g.59087 Transcript_48985/m.59087 type:complete len:745 (+) Transcript_48985:71-2305(+)|eukprot:CAMPEP_0194390518 /NCGR_PEP_ID=MMETSP0174-20130528/110373_1 /TAXON_ID=216777 /ORGANISM="Proboscia alata, Strain PI-D3" /LENGTH=744 /DNA_ID=CAMNT_0039183939 /DNA_START=46 /DNA_END=2280 /DNA_ORIENTATION=-
MCSREQNGHDGKHFPDGNNLSFSGGGTLHMGGGNEAIASLLRMNKTGIGPSVSRGPLSTETSFISEQKNTLHQNERHDLQQTMSVPSPPLPTTANPPPGFGEFIPYSGTGSCARGRSLLNSLHKISASKPEDANLNDVNRFGEENKTGTIKKHTTTSSIDINTSEQYNTCSSKLYSEQKLQPQHYFQNYQTPPINSSNLQSIPNHDVNAYYTTKKDIRSNNFSTSPVNMRRAKGHVKYHGTSPTSNSFYGRNNHPDSATMSVILSRIDLYDDYSSGCKSYHEQIADGTITPPLSSSMEFKPFFDSMDVLSSTPRATQQHHSSNSHNFYNGSNRNSTQKGNDANANYLNVAPYRFVDPKAQISSNQFIRSGSCAPEESNDKDDFDLKPFFPNDDAETSHDRTFYGDRNNRRSTLSIVRAPLPRKIQQKSPALQMDKISGQIPNPHPPSVVHDKYWAQRRRLFSRFDEGIELDSESWYSVTPEAIADHVARRMGEMASSMIEMESNCFNNEGIVILDAFCGCGGNGIAFGKLSPFVVSKVVCVDMDRSKLRKAAHNAALYGIPSDKIVFIEFNSLVIMDQCYREGYNVLNNTIGSFIYGTVETEICEGFSIGGLNLLPPQIDAVFIDPPWGGVDYGSMGKNGYDLAKHMKINYFKTDNSMMKNPLSNANELSVDGVGLLKMAAAATKSKLVVYDIPKNTNKSSLGLAAISAGYEGNMKLEEHYLNGRLKTVTAYMGRDYSHMLETA